MPFVLGTVILGGEISKLRRVIDQMVDRWGRDGSHVITAHQETDIREYKQYLYSEIPVRQSGGVVANVKDGDDSGVEGR